MVTNLNENNFNEEIKSGKVLVDFNASWCGPCRMLSPIIEEIAKENTSIKICSVDIDNEEMLAEQFGISSIPCLILFEDGKEIKRNIGFQPKEEVLKFIK